jgi:hypothetical protein
MAMRPPIDDVVGRKRVTCSNHENKKCVENSRIHINLPPQACHSTLSLRQTCKTPFRPHCKIIRDWLAKYET